MSAPLTTEPVWPDALGPAAFHGLAGAIVRAIEPHTEADPVALLVQLLVMVGNLIGPRPHFRVEADQHRPNEYIALVGETAKARKGVSVGWILWLMLEVEPEWKACLQHGLSSGEGLISAVRDAGGLGEKDPGVADKRLMIIEGELATPLRVMERQGNTLSPVLRTSWDSGSLGTLTKNALRATGAHVSVIGHVTRDEVRRYLQRTELGNGFGNRFLWICVRRSKLLPEGGSLELEELRSFVDELTAVVTFARRVDRLERDDRARQTWAKVYGSLSAGRLGLLGAVTARAEAHVMRLALIYALLDRSRIIRQEHLIAALLVWEYAFESARVVFGTALGDPGADELEEELRARPEGMTREEIRNLFHRNVRSEELSRRVRVLEKAGRARMVRDEETGGRPAERWLHSTYAVNAVNAERESRPSSEETYRVNSVYRVGEDDLGGRQSQPAAYVEGEL